MKKVVVKPKNQVDLISFEGDDITAYNNDEGILIICGMLTLKDGTRQRHDDLAVFNAGEWSYWQKIE